MLQVPQAAIDHAEKILQEGTPEDILALFAFEKADGYDLIAFKFQYWAYKMYPRYFQSEPAEFHSGFVLNMLRAYYGDSNYINLGFRGCAKRQPSTSKVLTPNGWKLMGDVEVGDYAIGSRGQPVHVDHVTKIHDGPVYELVLEDGRKVECDPDHIWSVRRMSNVKDKTLVIDTKTMRSVGLYYDRKDRRTGKEYKEYKYAIEPARPVQFSEKDLPIDPYTLGVILGDGSISDEAQVRIHLHEDDEETYRKYIPEMSGNVYKDKRRPSTLTIGILGLGPRIKELNLIQTCYTKRVPEKYLYGSIEQRRALLEGLMDTDGTAGSGSPSFSTVSKGLAEDVAHLVRSLGGRASIRENNWNKKISYRVNIRFTDYKPFRLQRKLDKCNLQKNAFTRIIDIVEKPNAPGRCIKVSTEDGLYLTDDFVVTHNTTYSKLFLTFVLLNDTEHYRKYIKVLTRNFGNAKQMVTDVYNMMVEVRDLYGDVMYKEKDIKREETMGSFTTVDGVKLLAGTIGMTQRGHIQDAYRPDFLVFDDVEDRESIQSLATTEATIWRIDEAIQGLSANGAYMCNGNYISEEGVVQWFLNKPRIIADKIAIADENGEPTWPARYDKEKIAKIKDDADDFYGEYMCDPTRADASFFERSRVDADINAVKQPTRESAGVKYWGDYQPHHKYGIGADTSEGIGKDANTFALFDFGVFPNDIGVLVGTYFNNRIPPDLFGHELVRVGREFGNCIIAPENNNTGHATIATMRGYPNIYSERKEGNRTIKVTERLGWRTTAKSKPAMFFEFRKDYNDGLIKIYDINVLKEMRSYTTADLQGTQLGMVTRHFDLLMAVVIAWQMRKYATFDIIDDEYEEDEPLYSEIGL